MDNDIRSVELLGEECIMCIKHLAYSIWSIETQCHSMFISIMIFIYAFCSTSQMKGIGCANMLSYREVSS